MSICAVSTSRHLTDDGLVDRSDNREELAADLPSIMTASEPDVKVNCDVPAFSLDPQFSRGMTQWHSGSDVSAALSDARLFADQTFARAAGAPLVPGNAVRLLKDAKENYPAWLEAIAGATQTIHFETYIIHRDDIGLEFANALAECARHGVPRPASLRLARLISPRPRLQLTDGRCWPAPGSRSGPSIPLGLDRPFGWINRDHRKIITIDGRLAFVSGLCVGRDWVGYPERHIEPWRDTGVSIEGPAVARHRPRVRGHLGAGRAAAGGSARRRARRFRRQGRWRCGSSRAPRSPRSSIDWIS